MVTGRHNGARERDVLGGVCGLTFRTDQSVSFRNVRSPLAGVNEKTASFVSRVRAPILGIS